MMTNEGGYPIFPGKFSKLMTERDIVLNRFLKVTRKEDNKPMLVAVEAIDSIEPMYFTSIVNGKVILEEWSRITLRRSKMYEVIEKIEYFTDRL